MAASVVASVALPISNNFSFAPSMDAYGKLSEYGKLGAWSPLSLFALGEQGAWYDPSDLSTMFQDREGTTPVTADGQPVGLILDKSKGLAFNTRTNLPTMTCSATVVQTGNILTFSSSPLGDQASGSPPINGNLFYRMSFTVSGTGSVLVYVGAFPRVFSSGTYTLESWHGQFANYFIFRANTGGFNGTVTFSELREYIGNHATAPSDAARPLKTSTGASKWVNYDAIDDVLNATFPSSLGSSCTVCRANVGGAPTILTGQTIGTSYADSTDHAGLIIINRALTGQETTDVTAWLTAKGAT